MAETEHGFDQETTEPAPGAAVTERLAAVRARIAAAEHAAGRPAGSVTLVAVGKTFGADALAAAADGGVTDFGENYLDEAVDKQDALAERDLTWHYIGALQSNKTRTIAERFDWVHTVDRMRVARRLSDQRPPARGPLEVCLQVNLDGEESKAGATPEAAVELAREIAALPMLRLRGLMAIPKPREEAAAQRAAFARLRALADTIRSALPPGTATDFDVLSMGMTGDLEAAVAEGATHVRIGTALFGHRAPRPA